MALIIAKEEKRIQILRFQTRELAYLQVLYILGLCIKVLEHMLLQQHRPGITVKVC